MTAVRAEVTGTVWQVLVKEGESVHAGQVLLVIESMKMEISLLSPVAGTVISVRCVPDQQVYEGDALIHVA